MTTVCAIAEAQDFDKLWPLVEESLAGEETKLIRDKLREDLFGGGELEAELLVDDCSDTNIELDLELARLSYPVCKAVTVQLDDQLVGYLIFHLCYSPWRGRGVFVEIIYVKPDYRKRGLARSLFQKLDEICRDEGAKYIVFESTRIEPALKETLVRYGTIVSRDNTTHWSVFRIYL